MAIDTIKNQFNIIQFLIENGAKLLINIPGMQGQYVLHKIIGKRSYPIKSRH